MTTTTKAARIPRNGHNARSLEMIVSEPSSLTLPVLEGVMQMLSPLKPGYEWFSKDNFDKALQCFDALVQAQTEARADVINFFAGAIVDLYHRDRADRASSLVKEQPIREIPPCPDHPSYQLRASKLTGWSTDIPLDKLPVAAQVVRQATPDELYLVTYHPRESQAKYDPLIYAKYGDWLVKVAEWK